MIRFLLAVAIAIPFVLVAGEADVIDVKVRKSAPGVYDFDVTVKSVDKSWAYYADAFEVLAPDGRLLGRRELAKFWEADAARLSAVVRRMGELE